MSHIRHPLATTAAARPDHPVLVTAHRAWSAAKLRDAVACRAGGLVRAGLRTGDRIALVGALDSDWVIALQAIRWIGGVAMPLPADAPQSEVEAMLATSPVTAVLSSGGPVVDHPNVLPIADAGGPPAAEWFGARSDPQVVLMTSGTTGSPRPITLTVGQLLASALASAGRLGHQPDDAWLCCLPVHHIGGLSVLLRTAVYGTTAVVHGGFDPQRVGEALDDGSVSQVSLVPTMLAQVLDARRDRPLPPSVRTILVGGAAMPPDLLHRCRALRLPVALTWGMTEVGSQVATRIPGDLRAEPDCGLPLPGVAVEVEGGRLVVVGPIAPGGRIQTRDKGTLDAHGRVIVHGRGPQLIVSGGENIDPTEIEAALQAHPGIQEAVVVGRPDPTWGHRPIAFVVAADAPPDAEDLRRFLGDRLQRFKIPDAFHWRQALPRGPIGKVRRSVLAQEAEAMDAIDKR